MPVFDFVPVTTTQGTKSFGLRGIQIKPAPEVIANTLALSTTASAVTADTYLYGPTDPSYAQFESVTQGNTNLQTGAQI
jgi:hypothetical protein